MSALPAPEAADRVDLTGLHRWMRARRDDLVGDVVALIEHETPSDHPPLLRDGLSYIENWVTDLLGQPSQRTYHDGGVHGPTVVLDYPGGEPLITALAHYDTVFDAGTLNQWPVTIDGDRLSGPGAFDMKGGLVQMAWALKGLTELGLPTPRIRLVINGDEEIGSPYSRPIIEKAATDAAAVLVFEGSASGGAVKTARKGVGLFDIVATGIEAHAGLDPLAGASAIHEIARAVTTLHNGADLNAGTSINIGVLHGGRRRNVTAGTATAGVDVRVATLDEQRRVDQLLAGLHPTDPRVQLKIEGGWNRPVMTRTQGVADLYHLARRLATQLDLNLAEASVGGASDGNFVAALGIPVLDGLGAVGEGAHARHENISIKAMIERATLAGGIIASLGKVAP